MRRPAGGRSECRTLSGRPEPADPDEHISKLRPTARPSHSRPPHDRLLVRKPHDIEIERHLASARTRPMGWVKGQLPIRPQAEVLVRDGLGDLAEDSEAIEYERQAVAEEAAR